MDKSLYEYCLESNRMRLLDEWDAEKNEGLTPKDIPYLSKEKVCWTCVKGHQWTGPVYSRTKNHSNCPYCSGKKAGPEDRTVASDHPELVKEWHPTKNQDLTPSDVSVGSHRKVWWVCEKKHEWEAQVKSRAEGSGCPYCTNRKVIPGDNDLATTHPQIASQWHPTKNGKLTPQAVVSGNTTKVWWICPQGHEYKTSIHSRTGINTGCPVCSGKQVLPGFNDLASKYPDIAAQWHPTLNGTMTPQKVTPTSNQKAWWLCEKGHAYESYISSKTNKHSGCPYCRGAKVLPGFNDLVTTEPEVAKQWHPTMNGSLTPEMVTRGSPQKVWWECAQGHVWKAIIYSRTSSRKHGCPVCAGTVKGKRLEKYKNMLGIL